jgi:hypothetical protein
MRSFTAENAENAENAEQISSLSENQVHLEEGEGNPKVSSL